MKLNDLNLRGLKRVAIMGGTFDPIHLGHLTVAENVRINFNLDRVIFIPTGKPPHKESVNISADEHRYMMTVLATLNNPYFETSRIEIDRPGVSYTVDTLNDFKKECDSDATVYFIVGADALCDMVRWKNARELFLLAEFIAVPRPGYNAKKLKNAVDDIFEFYGAKMHYLDTPGINVSSTEIRNRIRSGNRERYLLTQEVQLYIQKHGLYMGCDPEPKKIADAVKNMLSDKRYKHTMGVADEAVKLANTHGLNAKKLYIAGLLHDCAKELSEAESTAVLKKYKVKPDGFSKKSNELLHGLVGSIIAEQEFGIDDADILNAIKNHTTGRIGMSRIEKALFLADLIEPSRERYNELNDIKEMAYVDMDKAVFLGMKMKIRYLTEKNRKVHPFTTEAVEYYKKHKIND